MTNQGRYFKDLNALLRTMPPGQLDMAKFEAHERQYGRRYADPPEIIERWLLDQQARVQDADRERVANSTTIGGTAR